MAKQLDEFPEGLKVGRPDKYPWSGPDGWLNGKVWVLEEGSDFYVKPDSFRMTAKSAAKSRGGSLKTAVKGSEVYLQFIKN
jgi:hypothetical protein